MRSRFFFRRFLRISLFVLWLPLVAQAQLTEEWMPPEDGWDWLKTASQEWIKGDLIAMYDDSLEFDSDEFGIVEIDWEDVEILRSNGQQSIRLNNGEIMKGKLLITSTELVFDDGRSFNRSRIMSVAPGDEGERNYWDGSLGISVDKRSGNTDSEDLSLSFEAQRRTAKNRLRLDYRGIYGKTDGVEDENNHRFTSTLDWFFSPTIFLRPASFEYYSDPFQNIAHRYSYSSQVGYHIYDLPNLKWDVQAGPGALYTQFDKINEGEDDNDITALIDIGTLFEWDITNDIEYDFLYSVKYVSESAGEQIHHLETGLDIDLIGELDLNIRLIIDRIDKPIADDSGELPDKSDERVLIGVSYDF